MFYFYYLLEENILFNYNLDVIFFLVPNCPFYYVGAKLSWCQIVRCQIVRFYYVGAKLSWCQIVRCQIVLVPNCPGAKLSGAKLSGAKLSYHLKYQGRLCLLFSGNGLWQLPIFKFTSIVYQNYKSKTCFGTRVIILNVLFVFNNYF